MKLYQAGLLLAGAGVAGAIAFRMTQPPPITVPAPATQSVVTAPPVAAPPVSPPAIVETPQKKPSPVEAPPTLRAAAPETLYDEPAKPDSRKNEPNLQSSVKPKQWVPGRYESGGGTATAAAPVASKRSPAPVLTASIDKNAATPVQPAIEKQAPSPSPAPALAPAPTAAVPSHHATLRTGMAIVIRLNESLSSDYNRTGGTFAGSLAEPVIADGFVIAEQGAHVTGRIVDAQKGGRSTGMSRLSLGLINILTSDGQQVSVTTDPWMKLGDSIASGTIIPFRLISRVTITEQQLASK